jgi:hypothetical protein
VFSVHSVLSAKECTLLDGLVAVVSLQIGTIMRCQSRMLYVVSSTSISESMPHRTDSHLNPVVACGAYS